MNWYRESRKELTSLEISEFADTIIEKAAAKTEIILQRKIKSALKLFSQPKIKRHTVEAIKFMLSAGESKTEIRADALSNLMTYTDDDIRNIMSSMVED